MTPSKRKRWNCTSAAVGALLWAVAPLVPLGSAPAYGSIEHVFVLSPLVATPLALALLSSWQDRPTALYCIAQRIQPVAAALVLASFFVPTGPLAGALALGWLIMAVVLAAGRARGPLRDAAANLSHVSLLAAHVFLPIGAVWLVLSRAGVGPRGFAPLTVFLAALHFHFSGFTLQILIAAIGRRLGASALHRFVAIGAIAGIPLIAAGNALASPVVKLVGVASMVLSVSVLAGVSIGVAARAPSRAARGLLLVSAGSVAAGMALAATYGVGELTGDRWIGIPAMVAMHGLLNALGFTLCGLGAHVLLLVRDGCATDSKENSTGSSLRFQPVVLSI
jgi:hypothetical protein